jgi:hypothetical protein
LSVVALIEEFFRFFKLHLTTAYDGSDGKKKDAENGGVFCAHSGIFVIHGWFLGKQNLFKMLNNEFKGKHQRIYLKITKVSWGSDIIEAVYISDFGQSQRHFVLAFDTEEFAEG